MLINSLRSTVLFLFVTTTLIACSGGEDRQAKYLERAKNYLELENYDKARIEAKNVLQINPKNADAHSNLGNGLSEKLEGSESEYAEIKAGIKTS